MWKGCWGKAADSFASSRLNASTNRQEKEIVWNKFQDFEAKSISDFSWNFVKLCLIINGTNLVIKGLQVQSGQLQLPDEQNDISCRGMMTMIFIINHHHDHHHYHHSNHHHHHHLHHHNLSQFVPEDSSIKSILDYKINFNKLDERDTHYMAIGQTFSIDKTSFDQQLPLGTPSRIFAYIWPRQKSRTTIQPWKSSQDRLIYGIYPNY